jgi:hypothetical protein
LYESDNMNKRTLVAAGFEEDIMEVWKSIKKNGYVHEVCQAKFSKPNHKK